MPLSASVLVNQEEVLELLESARAELPEEIKQARWVVKDRAELLAKARRVGEAIVPNAQEERVRQGGARRDRSGEDTAGPGKVDRPGAEGPGQAAWSHSRPGGVRLGQGLRRGGAGMSVELDVRD